MVFNPSSMDRLFSHAVRLLAGGGVLVVSVSAWYLLRERHVNFARTALKAGLTFGLVASLLQLVSGHESAVGVAKNQPAKLARSRGFTKRGQRAADALRLGWTKRTKRERRCGHSQAC